MIFFIFQDQKSSNVQKPEFPSFQELESLDISGISFLIYLRNLIPENLEIWDLVHLRMFDPEYKKNHLNWILRIKDPES